MITIKSNISEVIDKFKRQMNGVSNLGKNMLLNIAENIKQKLTAKYSTMVYPSYEELSEISGDIAIEQTSDNSCLIKIGSNTETFTMNDDNEVNPYFFIEFGFGIAGQARPTETASEYDWEYNVNRHTTYWWFRGTDGHRRRSIGYNGANAFSDIFANYRDICQQALDEELAKIKDSV